MTLLILIYSQIISSFLNVCIYRILRAESNIFLESHCTSCNSKLKRYDNISLFSYSVFGGKCRNFKVPISKKYPVMESLNAIFHIIMYYKFGFNLDFIFYSLLSSVLIVVTLIDLKEKIIPDILVIIILCLSILYKALNNIIYGVSPEFLSSIGGLLLAGGLFLTIARISKGGMGGGDVTLIMVLGFIVGGKYTLLTIYISFVFGAIISLFLIAIKLKSRKDYLPFGPFIVLAFFITILWGETLVNWYFKIFL